MEIIKPGSNINFLGNRRYAYVLSAVLIVVSLLSIPVVGKVQLGIDFTGGTMIQVRFFDDVKTKQIRDALKPLGENLIVQKLSESTVRQTTSTEQDSEKAEESDKTEKIEEKSDRAVEFIIRTDLTVEESEKLTEEVKTLLETAVGKGKVEIRGVEMVGPKVGKDLQEAAIWATVVALALLFIYVGIVRFGMSMALGAVICVIHDLIIIYGIFVWTGKEFNLTILAAMLTVIGYDINDTIVVCDRIRENIPLMRKKPLEEILNISINQTLARTILTSGFTLLVVIALLIFGTQVLQNFGWALAIGILFGTYSSIFVATPLVLAWDKVIPLKRT